MNFVEVEDKILKSVLITFYLRTHLQVYAIVAEYIVSMEIDAG